MSNWCKRCRMVISTRHERLRDYCYICGHDIEQAGRVPEIEVVRLGHFAGGSFGVAGNPSHVYEYWAVKGPFNSGNFSATAYTFLDEAEAEKCAKREREMAQAEADARQLAMGYDREAERKKTVKSRR